jgi:hypothetical protein
MQEEIHKIRVVEINETTWTLGRCSCHWFLKNNKCSHLIGISSILSKCVIPHKAMNIPIGQKRKRGRPANNAVALVIQPCETQTQTITYFDKKKRLY